MAWPTDFDSFPERSDGPGQWIYAAHINALQNAVAAVQAELGLSPSAAYATVAEYLGALSTGLTAGLAGKAPIVHQHTAGDVASGVFSTLRLGTGSPSSSNFLRGDGTWAVPAGGGGSAFIPGEVCVASNDMPTAVKDSVSAAGGFVCDGTNDQVQINQAIDKAAVIQSRNANSPATAESRGMVRLTGGRFNVSDPVLMRTAVTLKGSGWITELFAASLGADPLIKLATVNEHACEVGDLHVYGNWASGGTGHGIDFDMTGSAGSGSPSVGDYPSTAPDSYHRLYNLYINGFGNGTGRVGIRLYAASTANHRGNWIRDVMLHDVGTGVLIDGSSDNYLQSIHLGTAAVDGLSLQGGNNYVTNSSFTYCDNYGINMGSGRHTLGVIKLQDNVNGMLMGASTSSIAGMIIDTCQTDGLVISSDDFTIAGLEVMFRTSGRFGATPQTNGIRFSGSRSGLTMLGNVVPSNITNRVTGTAPTNSFIRIGQGSSGLYSVGS